LRPKLIIENFVPLWPKRKIWVRLNRYENINPYVKLVEIEENLE
jgi:hypothetical protein